MWAVRPGNKVDSFCIAGLSTPVTVDAAGTVGTWPSAGNAYRDYLDSFAVSRSVSLVGDSRHCKES